MRVQRYLLLFVLLVSFMIAGWPAQAGGPPDKINSYVVSVTPQPDGTLQMRYEFDYLATTDFPKDIQYLEVGVPNTNFKILECGPKEWVTGAKAITSGKSQVHLDFARLPKAGDKFQFYFVINQGNMAYPAGEDISFKFVPGWFDFAEIEELRVSWVLPSDNSLVKKLDPPPAIRDGNQVVWVTKKMVPNQKADPITLIYVKSAFPGLKEVKQGESSGGIPTRVIVLIVVIVVIIVFVVIFVVCDDGYGGGGYAGGYHSGGGGGGGGRGGGGGGGFSGRGSSCACVSSCACACACAGGGRVGCSERGFEILHWLLGKKGSARKGRCE